MRCPFIGSCHRIGLVVSLIALAFASCRSTDAVPDGHPLPFHVALIPTKVIALPSGTTADSGIETEGAGEAMRLDLTSEQISTALQRELQRVFVLTTLLPALDPEVLEEMDAREQDLHWQREAQSVGANLLLDTTMVVDPVFDGSRNEKFWLNLPLFLLGGPMCYFVSDRSYDATAELQAKFFEVTVVRDDLDQVAMLDLPISAKFEGADLRFLDRADGAGDYALSLLIPAGLLARETSEVEAAIQQLVPERLGQQLAAEVQSKRQSFDGKEQLGAFVLDSRVARAERSSPERLRLDFPVQELEAAQLLRYEVYAGGDDPVGGALFDQANADGLHLISTELDRVPLDTEYLTIRIIEANVQKQRSYTLPVSARPDRP